MGDDQPYFVTPEECECIRREYAGGATQAELVDSFDRDSEAIRAHVKGECQHADTPARESHPGANYPEATKRWMAADPDEVFSD